MLSILYSDFEQFGCPNCGCDAARGGLSSATCRHCGLHFEVRGSTVYSTCEYAAYPEDPENPRSEYVMEQAIRIQELVFQVGIGCLRMSVQKKENIGTTECKTFLDYRPSEPTWIQFKFQKEEFDLDMLDALSRKNGGVITKEIIERMLENAQEHGYLNEVVQLK